MCTNSKLRFKNPNDHPLAAAAIYSFTLIPMSVTSSAVSFGSPKKIAQKGTDFSYMASKGRDVSHLIGKTDYIDFKGLGYKGDPIIHGGRFKKLPMGYKPQ